VVTLTDEMYESIQNEALEYRRLLVMCRERILCEMERADRAERTIEVTLAALRKLVEEFNPDIAGNVAQATDIEAAMSMHWPAYEFIQQIQKEAEYQPC
jgi:hypothetical protein